MPPHTALRSAASASALRVPQFRVFFLCTALTMLADNIEHVITYWVMFRRFHSTGLGAFAVISHWLPFLLLSMQAGALADRVDPRRMIQAGMLLFMLVSAAWAVLLSTDRLEPWHAGALLIVHGIAGVLWGPASQLLLQELVRDERLPSAVRLNATARYLGLLTGPAAGSALLLAVGPAPGLAINVLIYLPMSLWLFAAPWSGSKAANARDTPRGVRDMLATLGVMARSPILLHMTLLAGGAAFFIGNAYQAQMPDFAQQLGFGDPGVTYGMLLAADAAGALCAGLLLERLPRLHPQPRTALLLAIVWCLALAGFAGTRLYALALPLLFVAGFVALSFNSMAQALVQLNAPAGQRGRVIGVFWMAGSGLRTFSGVTVGMLGTLIGVRASLAASALALLTGVGLLASRTARRSG